MKERPILFSALMVRALLVGTKTQTRRVVKRLEVRASMPEPEWQSLLKCCPYGQPGDRLWVREAFQHDPLNAGAFVYRASVRAETVFDKWTPSIHMPRKASRITLEVTGVRVERLQDISEADAVDEGMRPTTTARALHGESRDPPAYTQYADLWEQINGPGSWDANPWVWVVEFQRAAK